MVYIALQTFAGYLHVHLGRLDKLQGKVVTLFVKLNGGEF